MKILMKGRIDLTDFKANLKMIKGGLSMTPLDNDKLFVSAYITDTRLMGVMCMYIHWIVLPGKNETDYHQFFYFESEELGLETYKSITGNDITEITIIEQTLIGGLGGKQIDITRREAVFLLHEFVNFNRERNIPMPSGYEEFYPILKCEDDLSNEEKSVLAEKQCTKIQSEYQAINYFLMRIFGKDYKGAKYLMGCDFDTQIYNSHPAATLCKNTIDESEDGNFLCQSLVEFNDSYNIIVSELQVQSLKITGLKKISDFKISTMEASMLLSRPEFVTVYDILINPDKFDTGMMELTVNTMVTLHENGKLFLAFNKHNDHVNKRVFRLSEDIYGLYYVTKFGQLIAASYSLDGIHSLEKDLRHSLLSKYLITTSKYEFKEPILYDFVQSDFEEFEDFLDYIKDDD